MASNSNSKSNAAAAPSETEYEDCLACRITGTMTLLGVSAYFFNERSKVPRREVGHRRWLLACCGAFAVAGVWRATTSRFASPVETDESQTSKP